MCHPSPGFASLYASCPQISPHHTPSFVISPQQKGSWMAPRSPQCQPGACYMKCRHSKQVTHWRHLISQRWVSELRAWFPATVGHFIEARQCNFVVDGLAFWYSPQGGWNVPSPHLRCGYGGVARMLCFPGGKCRSAAGHMSDQRRSGAAQSHWCLLTAGWVMESRANRWAPDRAGIKGALSEKQDGGTQRGSRENGGRKGRERKRQMPTWKVKMLHKYTFILFSLLENTQNDKRAS